MLGKYLSEYDYEISDNCEKNAHLHTLCTVEWEEIKIVIIQSTKNLPSLTGLWNETFTPSTCNTCHNLIIKGEKAD